MFLSVSLSASFCFCLVFVCFRVMARFCPVQTWPDLCLLLCRAHGGATWGHTVSAETEMERPRGPMQPGSSSSGKSRSCGRLHAGGRICQPLGLAENREKAFGQGPREYSLTVRSTARPRVDNGLTVKHSKYWRRVTRSREGRE